MRLRKCPSGLLSNGGCDLAADPNPRADRAPVMWRPHLNPATVVVAPAPDEFTDARSMSELTPAFSRRTATGEHWLLDQGCDAMPVVLIDGANIARPAPVVISLDPNFPTRIEVAVLLRRAMTGGAPVRAPDGLTASREAGSDCSSAASTAGLPAARIAPSLNSGLVRVRFDRAWLTAHDLRGRTRLCHHGLDLMHGEYLNLLSHRRRFRC
jgi:hypothetical protein